jgi:predicted GNAT family acetyltransferase
MQLERFETVEGFLAVAEEFLVEREAEHNLLLGICNTLLTAPGVYAEPPYLAVVTDGGRVVGVVIQTPPWDVALSEMDDARAVDVAIEDRLDEQLPGVIGPSALAARFANGWTNRTGTPAQLAVRERAFRLSQVIAPRRAPGRMRAARPGERDLLFQWLGEFTEEALGGHLPADLGQVADRWAAGLGRTMQLWIDNGLPVSMTGVGSPTPHGIRIGPVYTPLDLRRRGYASNLVAAACVAALESGRQFCFLFTDLANPTSNHIYQEIGFEPVTDVDRWSFGP